jgi:hypothetical protein
MCFVVGSVLVYSIKNWFKQPIDNYNPFYNLNQAEKLEIWKYLSNVVPKKLKTYIL